MSLGGYLAFTLYLGAAMNDASGDQRRLLRTTMKPLLARMKEVQEDGREWGLVAQSVLINVHRIMGLEWRPNHEWSNQIKLLLQDDPHATHLGGRDEALVEEEKYPRRTDA